MNQLQLISKYRSQLMGISALLIMIYHLELRRYVSHIEGLYFFLDMGYACVDIFLFLSGFGLFFASQKKSTTGQFYMNRFIRIVPTYLIFVLLDHLASGNRSVTDFLLEVSTIGFWTYQAFYDWYVPAIAIFYLLFPLYIKWFNKQPHLATLVSIIVGIGLTLVANEYYGMMDIRKLVPARIPVFAIGVLLGKYSMDETKKDFNWKPILYGLSVVGLAVLYVCVHRYQNLLWTGMYWLPFMIIVPGVSLFVSSLFNRFVGGTYIDKLLIFLGGISLEIYLAHLIPWKNRDWIMSTTGLGFYWANILIMIVSILGAYLVSLVTNRIVQKYKQGKKNNKN